MDYRYAVKKWWVGAFDIDNNKSYLNSIPFADHGALLDPPTVDVSARCISFSETA